MPTTKGTPLKMSNTRLFPLYLTTDKISMVLNRYVKIQFRLTGTIIPVMVEIKSYILDLVVAYKHLPFKLKYYSAGIMLSKRFLEMYFEIPRRSFPCIVRRKFPGSQEILVNVLKINLTGNVCHNRAVHRKSRRYVLLYQKF